MQFEWELVHAHLCAGEIRLWLKEPHHFFISVILGADSVFWGRTAVAGQFFVIAVLSWLYISSGSGCRLGFYFPGSSCWFAFYFCV
jgi:hypothetical protein